MFRKDLACAKSLGDAGGSLCRSYSSQKKAYTFYHGKKRLGLRQVPQRRWRKPMSFLLKPRKNLYFLYNEKKRSIIALSLTKTDMN